MFWALTKWIKELLLFMLVFLSFQSQVMAPPADITQEVTEKAEEPSHEIEGEWVLMEVTAYTAGYESCQKTPGDLGYGITASGEKVQEHHTLAAGPSVPFGTKIYIPEFMKTFVVEDRGGAITDNHLDIYMERLEDANEFGRKDMYVFVIQGDG
jgi:3D (Asp-Asp-Asp) domain-containing protein